jgi:ABC-type branched-subunit amino acid transport system substrate-binding protein
LISVLREPSNSDYMKPLGQIGDGALCCNGRALALSVGVWMARNSIRIGILFSRSGSYALLGEAMRAGALLAVDEVNADRSMGLTLSPVEADPGGRLASYAQCAHSLLVEERLTHVVGCYTSSSRKEVLPLFDKHDALLWYPSHYEGFETSENAVYTGAAPNQHIVPLTRYMLATGRRTAWLVGSNYIWAWENNRIMREGLQASGGRVLGERYFPVGETDLAVLAALILDQRPDFVFSTLIGRSAYAFFRLLRTEAERRGLNQREICPIASCSLAEPELAEIGHGAADGHLSSSVYFSTVSTPANAQFTAAWRNRFGGDEETSADAEASYIAVHLLARALALAGTEAIGPVRKAISAVDFEAPQGPVRIDGENRHCFLWPRIGRSRADGVFDIVWEAPAAVRPDPYLVWDGIPEGADGRAPGNARPDLRIVS